MTIKPIVRYMLLCEDWQVDEENDHRITIIGLVSNIRWVSPSPPPFVYRELCVFLVLTDGYGTGQASIVCVFEETGELIFRTSTRQVIFGRNPLKVVGVPFRIQDCPFPYPRLYSIQFWYDEELIEERNLKIW